MMDRMWRNVEIIKGDGAEKFRTFLLENRFKYEPSECFNCIHFEIFCDKQEEMEINDFLHDLAI